VLAAEYQTVLPDEKLIAEELDRSRRELEKGVSARSRGSMTIIASALWNLTVHASMHRTVGR
jgi:hypothetical protein